MFAPYLYNKMHSAYDAYSNYKAKKQAPSKS